MEADRRVLLVVASDGSVTKVLDAASKQPVSFSTVAEEEVPAQAPSCAVRTFVDREWTLAETAAWCTYRSAVRRFVPLHHCRVERQLPRGCVYVMPGEAVPPADDWFPLDGRYCTGVSVCEIEGRLAGLGAALTAEYFATPEFKARFEALGARLFGPAPAGRDRPPG